MPKTPPRPRSKAALDGQPIPMPTPKLTEDPRRQFYSLARSMERTAERIRRMCQDPVYYQHKINQRHFLRLDDAFCLQFLREGTGVSLHIELAHGKPTRDGLVYWWPVIEQWQELLMEWHGSPRGVSIAVARLVAQLLDMKRGKVPHSKIANWLNEQIRKARQREADIEKNPLSSLVATIPGLKECLQGYKRDSSADQIIKYFIPKGIDDHEPITSEQVRERLRYRLKTSR